MMLRLSHRAAFLFAATVSVVPLAQAAAQSAGVNAAYQSWPGEYFSSEGSRIQLKKASGWMISEGSNKGGVVEKFMVNLTDPLTGSWMRGSTKGQLEGAWTQPSDRIELTLKTTGRSEIYRLCRVGANDASIVSSSRGVWADLKDHSLFREADGSTTMIVQLRVLNVGERTTFNAGDLTAQLPDTTSRPAGTYYNPATGEDNGPMLYLSPCQQGIIHLRFRNVTSANKTLALISGTFRTHDWDISAITAKIAQETPPQPQPSEAAAEARRTWPGTYFSSEGTRLDLSVSSGNFIGYGVGKDGIREAFKLTAADRLSGTWNRDGRQAQLEGPYAQTSSRLEFTRTQGGNTDTYRLCRVGDSDAKLEYLGQGIWVAMTSHALVKEPDGTHTLYVKTRAFNTGPRRNITPNQVSAVLPGPRPAAQIEAYYNPDTRNDDLPYPEADTCGSAYFNIRFKDVRKDNAALNFSSDFAPRVHIDIRDITGGIEEAPAGPQQPGPQRPTPQTPQQPEPQTPADDFQPLGRWDVRVDKVENPRDDRLTHVYLTLRNASTQTLLQTGDVWVYLEDTSGVTQSSGQGVRAIPGPPQLFGSPPPVVLPGKTIKAKYIFDRVRGVSITRVTVAEGDHQAEYAF